MEVGDVPVAILAGGLGTRLGDLSRNLPKALVPVGEKPFIIHQLEWLRRQGSRRVVLCVGHRGEMITRAVGDGRKFGLQVEYSHDGPKLLGTAGALRGALPKLGGVFFVLYGDSYLDCDLGDILRRFPTEKSMALMTVYRNENRWGTSNVKFVSGKITVYDKMKPVSGMNHIDYGLGLFRREAFRLTRAGRPSDLERVYQQALKSGALSAVEVSKRFYEIGSPAGLEELRKHLTTENRL